MVDIPGQSGPMCNWPEVFAVPHALAALQQLNQTSHCHLATNAKDSGPDQIRAALARVGLDSYIQKIFCFRTVGHPKPSPAFFDFIVHDLQIARSSLIMVGDNLEKDVLGAQLCGLKAIWYNPMNALAPDGVRAVDNLLKLIHAPGLALEG